VRKKFVLADEPRLEGVSHRYAGDVLDGHVGPINPLVVAGPGVRKGEVAGIEGEVVEVAQKAGIPRRAPLGGVVRHDVGQPDPREDVDLPLAQHVVGGVGRRDGLVGRLEEVLRGQDALGRGREEVASRDQSEHDQEREPALRCR
jgi:hypothetical protein